MNTVDIKKTISNLRFYQKVAKETDAFDLAAHLITEIKQSLRRKFRAAVNIASPYTEMTRLHTMLSDYSDVIYVKQRFDSYDEAKDYCNKLYEDNQICSAYDCTGQLFISNIRFAHMKDNVYLIRTVWSRDV